MKKIKPINLILAMFAIAMTGCEELPQEQRDIKYRSYFSTVNYNGHRYVVFSRSAYENGITHDPDCPCYNDGDVTIDNQ